MRVIDISEERSTELGKNVCKNSRECANLYNVTRYLITFTVMQIQHRNVT